MKLLGKTPQTRRIIFALGLAFASVTSGAYAQTLTDINNVLSALYKHTTGTAPHLTTVNGPTVATATPAQLEAAFEVFAAPTSATVTGYSSGATVITVSGSNAPAHVAAYVGLLYGAGGIAKAPASTTPLDLLNGFINGVNLGASGDAAVIAANIPAVAAALDSASIYTTTTASDTADATLLVDEINDAPTVANQIIDQVLATSDPNPVQQAALFMKGANVVPSGDFSLQTLSTDLAASGDITAANEGLFVETAITKAPGASSVQAANQLLFLQGFTSTQSLSALVTTATSTIANSTTAFSTADRESLFAGLVLSGSANSAVVSSTSQFATLVNQVANGVLTGPAAAATDTARATLTSNLITTAGLDGFLQYEEQIAAGGAAALTAPNTDAAAYTTTLLTNADVKTGNGSILADIPGITTAIANVFTLGDITSSSGNIVIKEAIAQAGILALPADAGVIASDVASQVLTSGSSNAALDTFGANFVGGIPSKASFTAADKAQTALGLIEAYDTAGITGGAIAISASAVATNASSALNINNVAQPILQHFNALNNTLSSGTEVEAIAAQIAKTVGTYGTDGAFSYTPVYLAAQLMEASKASPSAPIIATLAEQIAYGTATDPVVDSTYTSPDTFVTDLAGQFTTAANVQYLVDIATSFVGQPDGAGTFTDTGLVTDIATLGGSPALTGTVAAEVALAHSADATAIAYAGANGSGVTTDLARDVIAEDVTKNEVGAAVSISGSVGTLIAVNDKPAFAEDITALDNGAYSSIALAVANSVPSTSSTVATAIANIEESVIAASTSLKVLADIEAVTDNLAENYTGNLNPAGALSLDYQNAAVLAQQIDAKYVATVTGLNTTLATDLVPYEIGVSGDNTATAALISGSFTAALPSTTTTNIPVTIANLATAASLYGGAPSAAATGQIGVDITAALLPTTANELVSGSVAALVAENALTGPGTTTNDNLNTVAGVFASSSVTPNDFVDIAKDLGGVAMAEGDQAGADITLAAIGSAFAPALAAQSGAYTNLKALLADLIALNNTSKEGIDYIYGAIFEASGAPANMTLAGDLLTAAEADLTATQISALFPASTAALSKAAYIAWLNAASGDADSSDFASINPDETPTLNF